MLELEYWGLGEWSKGVGECRGGVGEYRRFDHRIPSKEI